jgi:hypothetical protein
MLALSHFFFKRTSIAPLITLRITFGGLLLYSTLRSIQKGWVEELYIEPTYHFGFFSWLEVAPPLAMQLIFWLKALFAVFIIMGLFYRFATLGFFALFTYVELIDKTYYLNHYYLVSLLCFWLFLVPANRKHSLDALLFPKLRADDCANWQVQIFRIQLSIVYFFAGLAKVNPDWLFRAQPMATWLPHKYEIPLLGKILYLKETAFIFSWAGCVYDLFIWIFLWLKRFRGWAYIAVLVFHFLTAILFPRIGMFPFIMITSTLIFFSAEWHEKWQSKLFGNQRETVIDQKHTKPRFQSLIKYGIVIYLIVQLILPLRYLIYEGNLFWHEQGYRFSWRVMLMEKNGYTTFILRDPTTGKQTEVEADHYLTAFQLQQMKSQPDMIFQFAQYLGDEFEATHRNKAEIYVESRMSLNGRRSQPFVDKSVNVLALDSPYSDGWLIDFKDEE